MSFEFLRPPRTLTDEEKVAACTAFGRVFASIVAHPAAEHVNLVYSSKANLTLTNTHEKRLRVEAYPVSEGEIKDPEGLRWVSLNYDSRGHFIYYLTTSEVQRVDQAEWSRRYIAAGARPGRIPSGVPRPSVGPIESAEVEDLWRYIEQFSET